MSLFQLITIGEQDMVLLTHFNEDIERYEGPSYDDEITPTDLCKMIKHNKWDLFYYYVDRIPVEKRVINSPFVRSFEYMREYGFVYGWRFSNNVSWVKIHNAKRDRMHIIRTFFPYFRFGGIIKDYMTSEVVTIF